MMLKSLNIPTSCTLVDLKKYNHVRTEINLILNCNVQLASRDTAISITCLNLHLSKTTKQNLILALHAEKFRVGRSAYCLFCCL